MTIFLLAVDAYLLGLGVVVSVVVYPAFSLVGDTEWPAYHAAHSRAITWAVGPAWLLQGVLSAWWILSRISTLSLIHGVFAATGVLLTILGAVPQHNRIAVSRDVASLTRLANAHRLRTAAWLAATLCAAWTT